MVDYDSSSLGVFCWAEGTFANCGTSSTGSLPFSLLQWTSSPVIASFSIVRRGGLSAIDCSLLEGRQPTRFPRPPHYQIFVCSPIIRSPVGFLFETGVSTPS